MQFQKIKIEEIKPSPFNPRRSFEGPSFDELTESIREKGIIQPILVRPIEGGYEIVAGERRYRAAKAVNGGGDVPAIIRELSDDDAFDMMTTENLQREDLTELEEAQSFAAYIKKRGDGAIEDLAKRTGIHPGYIRRRVGVLGLPKKVLKAWETGKLSYGHLEQLMRIGDKKALKEFITEIFKWRPSVKGLKQKIEQWVCRLKMARFDIDKEGCNACNYNSESQRKLFGLDDRDKARCLNIACFKQKQNNILLKNWARRKTGTNGFRFYSDISYSDWEEFYRGGPWKQCKTCEKFISIIDIDGEIVYRQVCLDESCMNQLGKSEKKSGTKKDGAGDGPRVAWHGEYFREKFYQSSIPEKFSQLRISAETPDANEKKDRLALYALIKSNHELDDWFIERCDLNTDDYDWLGDTQLFRILEKMEFSEIKKLLEEATLQTILQQKFGSTARQLVADHIGVDLKKEWLIDEEYLNKKTKAEILAIGEKFGVFDQKAAKDFLFMTLMKKRGKFSSCKKSELKRIFLESGADLSGVVPEEIITDGDE